MAIQASGGRPSLGRLGVAGRRAVAVSDADLVVAEPLRSEGEVPLVISPRRPGVDLCAWAAAHRPDVERHLVESGGILFRGFGLTGPEDLERFIAAVSDGSLEYKERSSPRSAVAGNIYTSTDHPPSQSIFLHNENSYQSVWPRKIFFLCTKAAASGGATPIADCRRVMRRIDPAIRDRFVDKGWMVVRNFGSGFGLDWPTVFQTEDRGEVEAHCLRAGIECEWRPDGNLRTRARRSAVAEHPVSGEAVWFNHATFFHVTTLEPTLRDTLLDQFAEEDLPANTFYGDGSPIEAEVLDHLREAYRAETVRFPWREGDLLLLDNMLVAHGRDPFEGERRVLVGMAEPVRRAAA